MTEVVMQRKCEKCGSVVNQTAFFHEEKGIIKLEWWTKRCPSCDNALKKPTEDELRDPLLIKESSAQSQLGLSQTLGVIRDEIRWMTESVIRLVKSNEKQSMVYGQYLEKFTILMQYLEKLFPQMDKFLSALDESATLVPVLTHAISTFLEELDDLQETQGALTEKLDGINNMTRSFKEPTNKLDKIAKSFEKSINEHLKTIEKLSKESERMNSRLDALDRNVQTVDKALKQQRDLLVKLAENKAVKESF